jgi:hypothetical protein
MRDVPPIYTASRTKPLRYLPYPTPADPNEYPLTTKCTEHLPGNCMACQLCICLVVSAFFAARTVLSWAGKPAVRKPLTVFQAATASCSNYHCRHVGHIHYLTLRVRHLLLPILTAASSYITSWVVTPAAIFYYLSSRQHRAILFSNHDFLRHSHG